MLLAILGGSGVAVRSAEAAEGTEVVDVGEAAGGLVTAVEVQGNRRTRRQTLLELLPRPVPAHYTGAELAEFERRLRNLAIFDHVKVQRRGERLEIEVREKWTLIPSVEFSSGQTVADTYALLGVTEYNLLGTADLLNVSVFREQRGWGTGFFFSEHTYRRHRWTLGAEGYLYTAEYRFEEGSQWRTAQGTGGLWFTSPPVLSDYLNVRVESSYAREVVSEVQGPTSPPSSHAFRAGFSLLWDQYKWEDLVPRGLRAEGRFGTGMQVSEDSWLPRHAAELSTTAALPLGKLTVLTFRANASALTRGNANFSHLLGSVRGVRGLPDSLYRTWAQGFVNLELRQAVKLAERWALQGVLFGDLARFSVMTAGGSRGRTLDAASIGLGARLVPTWLASVVLRADLARLLAPDPAWFLQIGLGQYF